jgi:hypothetical protein
VARVRRLATLLLVMTCLGATLERVALAEPAAAPSARRASAPRPPPGCLWREQVLATIRAGLGSFLQRVDVEPSLVDGKFSGFSIVALRPSSYWRGVDLRSGDIVTSVNGMPIERPTQAYAAFVALGTAAELRVSLIRDGAPRRLVYRILNRASPARSRDGARPAANARAKKP